MAKWASGVPVPIGQTGTTFRVTIQDPDGTAIDVSAATVKQLKFKNPAGTTVTKTAAFTVAGVDGQIEYSDTDGSLANVEGDWKFWGAVTLAGKLYLSSTLRYKVEAEGEG